MSTVTAAQTAVNAVKTPLKTKLAKYLVKAIGAGALGLVAYDAHTLGKINSDVYAKRKDADAVADMYSNTMFLNQPSTLQNGVKKTLYKFEVDSNFRTFFNSIIGYIGGVGSMLVSEVVALGLGAGALFVKNKTIAKGCGIGLLAYGALNIIKNGFGLGHKNDLNPKF